MKFVFWLSLIFVFYTYAGYPLFLFFLAKFRKARVAKGAIFPTASVVVAVHNEEKNIGARLENLLSQEYPREDTEIIVVSDGSTDRSEEVVRSFGERGVRLLSLDARQGKAVALNHGVAGAGGEIVVFTDARQVFRPDAVKELAANFSDPTVGCVSGELVFLTDRESGIQAEMGAYWRYEKFIRRNEGRSGSAVGATGAIYAIRKTLYRPLPAGTLLDDVLTPMNIVMQGYRCIFDGKAVAGDIVSRDVAQEWRRKVRTLAGNWQLLSLAPGLLLPWRNPILGRFLSHKIFRLLVPFVLPIVFLCGAMSDGTIYSALTWLQGLLYGMALVGAAVPASRKLRFMNLSYFFLVMNLAAVEGFRQWLTGGCRTAWRPAYADQGKIP